MFKAPDMPLSEILVYVAYACAFFVALITIVVWRDQRQAIDTSEEGM